MPGGSLARKRPRPPYVSPPPHSPLVTPALPTPHALLPALGVVVAGQANSRSRRRACPERSRIVPEGRMRVFFALLPDSRFNLILKRRLTGLHHRHHEQPHAAAASAPRSTTARSSTTADHPAGAHRESDKAPPSRATSTYRCIDRTWTDYTEGWERICEVKFNTNRGCASATNAHKQKRLRAGGTNRDNYKIGRIGPAAALTGEPVAVFID